MIFCSGDVWVRRGGAVGVQVIAVSYKFINIFPSSVKRQCFCKDTTINIQEAKVCGESRSDAEAEHQQLLVSLGSWHGLTAPSFVSLQEDFGYVPAGCREFS